MSTYCSALPDELIHLLFLYFDPYQFIDVMNLLLKRKDIIRQQHMLKSITLWTEALNPLNDIGKRVKLQFTALNTKNIDIIKLIVIIHKSHGPISSKFLLNHFLVAAGTKGYLNIVRLLLDSGADAYDWALLETIRGENEQYKDIIKLLLDRGAKNYKEAIAFARHAELDDIIELIQSYE